MAVVSSGAVKPSAAGSAKGAVLVAATALLPIAAPNEQKGSGGLAADSNSAEKGSFSTATVLLHNERSSAPESSVPDEPSTVEPQQRTQQKEQRHSDINRVAEVHEAVEGAIKEFTEQENTSA
jgi:hypothetical protein